MSHRELTRRVRALVATNKPISLQATIALFHTIRHKILNVRMRSFLFDGERSEKPLVLAPDSIYICRDNRTLLGRLYHKKAFTELPRIASIAIEPPPKQPAVDSSRYSYCRKLSSILTLARERSFSSHFFAEDFFPHFSVRDSEFYSKFHPFFNIRVCRTVDAGK